MPIYTLQGPGGRTYEIEGPAGATADQLGQFIQSQAPRAEFPARSPMQEAKQTIGNVAAGALRGAGSIGATLLAPFDVASDLAQGRGLSLESNRERRQAIDEGLRALGAEPESMAYKGAKIAGEIAGTAGIPGAMAKGAQAMRAAPALVEALRTGGLTAQAGLPTRIAAGAATGAATGAAINPEEAGMGAGVGAAIPAGAAAAGGLATLLRKGIGASTGVGDEALAQAFAAGKQGGESAKALTDAMRGRSNMEDVLASAKQGLDMMGQQKQAAYRSGMANIKNDKTVLGFGDIDNALNDALSIGTYKGQVKNPEAVQAVDKIRAQIDEWKNLNPGEFHTPEGMDALKQSISGVMESIPFEQKTARLAAGKVYDAIKTTINKQAPEYAKVMKDYSESSELINEIQKALIGGNKATAESSMRKLQSLMRNNVNTSYGYRNQLAQQLEQATGQDIMSPLAGQALNDWAPRGIQRATAGSGTAGLAALGNVPAAAMFAAASSPRLMGEAYYGAGRAAGSRLADLLRQGAVTAGPVAAAQ